jgi:hypothetical protein
MLDFINFFNFCFMKDHVKRTKTQATEWKKTFANYITDRRLDSRIYFKNQE